MEAAVEDMEEKEAVAEDMEEAVVDMAATGVVAAQEEAVASNAAKTATSLTSVLREAAVEEEGEVVVDMEEVEEEVGEADASSVEKKGTSRTNVPQEVVVAAQEVVEEDMEVEEEVATNSFITKFVNE